MADQVQCRLAVTAQLPGPGAKTDRADLVQNCDKEWSKKKNKHWELGGGKSGSKIQQVLFKYKNVSGSKIPRHVRSWKNAWKRIA